MLSTIALRCASMLILACRLSTAALMLDTDSLMVSPDTPPPENVFGRSTIGSFCSTVTSTPSGRIDRTNRSSSSRMTVWPRSHSTTASVSAVRCSIVSAVRFSMSSLACCIWACFLCKSCRSLLISAARLASLHSLSLVCASCCCSSSTLACVSAMT